MAVHRRDFLKKSILTGGLACVALNEFMAASNIEEKEMFRSKRLNVAIPSGSQVYQPLDPVKVNIQSPRDIATVKVRDGAGNIYQTLSSSAEISFKAGGVLGYHVIACYNKKDELLDWTVFPVNCKTRLEDEKGEFSDFFNVLYETLTNSSYAHGKTVRYNAKYYKYYSSWFQDHVFVAEAMKYFAEDVKTGIDLYADGQREDGLIWDNYKHPYPDQQSYWEYRFDYGNFVYRPEDNRSTAIFVRVPVENIGEHTFIEGLYYAWKATGDTPWMASKLDNALKAVEFATSSPYYWSTEKKLLKRPYTIDRWDFQSEFDNKLTGRGDMMGVDLDKTRYGIMYGDNICMANACELLSEMLLQVGRSGDADRVKKTGEELWQRINELSWNGRFYRHWYPLDDDHDFDFGVDTSRQITLSNAMALIRGLEHDKCVKIINNYLDIKEEMPASSPGEWYMCYPPAERGWSARKWEYMNGGVSPILAGDLALGAFDHGYEKYGVDILRRLHKLSEKTDHKLEGCYKGKIVEAPSRQFTPVSLEKLANTDLQARGDGSSTDWFGGAEADFRNLPVGKQTMEGIHFNILDPATNNRKACITVGANYDNKGRVQLDVNQKAASVYLLHVADASSLAGVLTLNYRDGSRTSRYIRMGTETGHFWYPVMNVARKGIPPAKIAWKGTAKGIKEIGNYVFGMNNPHPEKEITNIEFYNPESSNWAIFGVTLSDAEHYLKPTIDSTIPEHWAAAHVFKALMEGMAGIRNQGLAFDKVVLAPRWELANVKKVRASARYECSDGYLAYEYVQKSDKHFEIEFTGNTAQTELKFLLPGNKNMGSVKINGVSREFSMETIEESRYACLTINEAGIVKAAITLA